MTPTLQQATEDARLRRRLLDTHRQVWVSPSGVSAPFSWVLVHTRFCCALKESASPVLWKFCNQIPLASKVKFPRGSQSLCQIPRLESQFGVLEFSYQCKNLFGIIVLQFVGRQLDSAMVGLMETSSKRAYVTPRTAAPRGPAPAAGHC